MSGYSDPASRHAAITPDVDFAQCRAIYVGVAGNVAVVVGGLAVTYIGAQAGSVLPLRATRVTSAGTTATSLVALY